MSLFVTKKKMRLDKENIDKMVKFRISRISHRSGRSRLPFITAKVWKIEICVDVAVWGYCPMRHVAAMIIIWKKKNLWQLHRKSIISLFLTSYDWHARMH